MVCNYIRSVWEVGNFTGDMYVQRKRPICATCFLRLETLIVVGVPKEHVFCGTIYSVLEMPNKHNYKLFFGGPEVGRGKTCYHRRVIYITLWILGKFPLIRYHSFVLIELDVTLWIIYLYIYIHMHWFKQNNNQKKTKQNGFWVHWFALDAPQDIARSFGLRNKRWNPGDEEFQRRNPTWSLGARTQGPQDKELGTSVDLSELRKSSECSTFCGNLWIWDGKLRRVGVGIEMRTYQILPYFTSIFWWAYLGLSPHPLTA